MSLRATGRLIGDVVFASGIPNSPLMVVQAVEEETKMVSAIWFSDDKKCQEGKFPASALDRAEQGKTSANEKKPVKKAKGSVKAAAAPAKKK